jgi:hypothetical protein
MEHAQPFQEAWLKLDAGLFEIRYPHRAAPMLCAFRFS